MRGIYGHCLSYAVHDRCVIEFHVSAVLMKSTFQAGTVNIVIYFVVLL